MARKRQSSRQPKGGSHRSFDSKRRQRSQSTPDTRNARSVESVTWEDPTEERRAFHYQRAAFHHEAAAHHHGEAARFITQGMVGRAELHAENARSHGRQAEEHHERAADLARRLTSLAMSAETASVADPGTELG